MPDSPSQPSERDRAWAFAEADFANLTGDPVHRSMAIVNNLPMLAFWPGDWSPIKDRWNTIFEGILESFAVLGPGQEFLDHFLAQMQSLRHLGEES